MENAKQKTFVQEESKGKTKKKQDQVEKKPKEKKKRLRVRLIPIWLRIILVLVFIMIFFFIGAMIGYSVIGDGKPTDVFKVSTWTHISEIVNEGTNSK